MPAVAWGVDAASDVSIQTLKDQGASFICTYLAPYPSQGWKMRTPAEWKAYLDAGIKIVANWESDGLPGNGFNDGVAAAKTAQSYLNDRNASDAVVYFTAADKDPTALNLNTVADYVRGAVSVLGWDRVGTYGGYGAIKFLADANVCKYFWQTYAWSGGKWDARAQLHQWKNTSTLDFDEAWSLDFGQYPRAVASVPAPAPAVKAMSEADQVNDLHIQLCQSWDNPIGGLSAPGHGWPVEMIANTHKQVCALSDAVKTMGTTYTAILQSYQSVQLDLAKIKAALKIDTPPTQ